MKSWSLIRFFCSIEVWRLWLSINLLWGLAQAIKPHQPPSKYSSPCSFLSISRSAISICQSWSWHQIFWMVTFPLLVPADLDHSTSTSRWVISILLLSMYLLSLSCHSFYITMIMSARSNRTEGSWWFVIVLLIVFSFLLCLPIGLAESAALPASSVDWFQYFSDPME